MWEDFNFFFPVYFIFFSFNCRETSTFGGKALNLVMLDFNRYIVSFIGDSPVMISSALITTLNKSKRHLDNILLNCLLPTYLTE